MDFINTFARQIYIFKHRGARKSVKCKVQKNISFCKKLKENIYDAYNLLEQKRREQFSYLGWSH